MTITDIERLNIHIKLLSSRLDALEDMVLKGKLEPQLDRSWVPFRTKEDLPKNENNYVEMLTRDDKRHFGYVCDIDWSNSWNGFHIVAWRYSEEGE